MKKPFVCWVPKRSVAPRNLVPNAPRTVQAVLAHVQAARERGCSITVETYTAGLNAMAAPVPTGWAATTGRGQYRRANSCVSPRRGWSRWRRSCCRSRLSSRPRAAPHPSSVGSVEEQREQPTVRPNRSMQPDSLTTSPERAMQVEHCDLLVAGSGAGGLSTAVVAAHLGLKVIVVEKDSQFGGTTARSGAGCGCHAIHWLSRRVLSKASTRHSTTCATSSVIDATSLWYALFLKTHRAW